MAFKREAIGGKFYLHHDTGSNSRLAVISSHGGGALQGVNFQTAVDLGFYQHTGQTLRASLNTALERPTEWARQGSTIEEYDLSKFQGSHGGNTESYGDIKAFVEENGIPVLTIRHRKGFHNKKSETTRLSDAIRILIGRGCNEIHCLFCRVMEYQYVNMFTGERFTG